MRSGISDVQILERLVPVSILAGESLSGGIFLGGLAIVGIFTPSAWTPGVLTMQSSPDEGGSFLDVFYPAGTEFVQTLGANQYIMLDHGYYSAFGDWIRLRSGTANIPVVQSATRVLKLVLRGQG